MHKAQALIINNEERESHFSNEYLLIYNLKGSHSLVLKSAPASSAFFDRPVYRAASILVITVLSNL